MRENFDPRSILKYLPPLDLTVPDNEFLGKRSTRRRTAAMAALREAEGKVEGDKRQKRGFGDFQRPEQQGPFPIYWTRQIVTNVGNMAFSGGTWIQIRSSGAYLVGIRPDNMEGDNYIQYIIKKNDTEIWSVLCDHSPGGQMAAFHCTANERMQIIQAGSTHCGVGIMSLVSVAQTRIIQG